MDISKMKCHEIISAIGEALSPEAQEEWDGMDDAGKNDFLIHAQREGFDSAVKLFEGSAKPLSYHLVCRDSDGDELPVCITDGEPLIAARIDTATTFDDTMAAQTEADRLNAAEDTNSDRSYHVIESE